jgi:hypothetical protein
MLGGIFYKFFYSGQDASSLASATDAAAIGQIEHILKTVDEISFDTGGIRTQKFLSLKSIEVPYITLPIGKPNPFLVNSQLKTK